MAMLWDFLLCLYLFPPQKDLEESLLETLPQCSVVERDEMFITVHLFFVLFLVEYGS